MNKPTIKQRILSWLMYTVTMGMCMYFIMEVAR